MKKDQPKTSKLETWKKRLEVAEKALIVVEKAWPSIKRIVGICLTVIPMIASWFADK